MKIKKVGESYFYAEGQFRRAIHKVWYELTGEKILPVIRKGEAEYMGAQIFALRHGKGGTPSTDNKGVDFKKAVMDYLRRCESLGQSSKTVTQKRQQLLGLNLKFVHQLTSEFLQKWLDTADMSGASKNRYASTFNRFIHYCHKIGYIRTRFILDRYPELKDDVSTLITPATFKALCAEADEPFVHVIELGYHTGMRRGEIFFLWRNNFEHVNFKTRIALFPAASVKNRIPKPVPLSKKAMKAIEGLKGTRPYVTADGITLAFKRTCKRAGVKLRFHDLRHTFVSRCREFADASITARIVGHKDPRTTELIYTHYGVEKLLEIVDRL